MIIIWILFGVLLILGFYTWWPSYKFNQYFKQRYPEEYKATHNYMVIGRYDAMYSLSDYVKKNPKLCNDSIFIKYFRFIKNLHKATIAIALIIITRAILASIV